MSDVVVARVSALLGFTLDDKNLTKFKVGIATANAALLKFTSDTLKTTQALTNLNIKTGISENFAYEWGRIADVSGIGKEAVLSALESISQAQADFERGEGNISPYTFLGINPMGKKPEEVFQDVLKALDKFKDNAKAKTKALEDLGLDPLLQSLNINNNGLDKNLLLNKQDIKSLQNLNSEFIKLRSNLAILRDKFIALATPIHTFLEVQNKIISGLSLLIKNTIGFERASKLLAGTILFLTSIIFPKLSILGLLLLAVEDFIVFMNGGRSVIGYFIEKIKILIGEFKNFSAVNKVIIGIIGTLIAGLTLFFAKGLLFNGVVGIFGKFSSILSGIVGLFKLLKLNNPFTIIMMEILGIVKGLQWFIQWIEKTQENKLNKTMQELNSDENIQKNWNKTEERMRKKGLSEEEIARTKENFYKASYQQRTRFEPVIAQNTQNNSGGNKTITQSNNNIINVNSVKEAVDTKRELEIQELDNIVMELNI